MLGETIVSSVWMDVASALLSRREHLRLFWTLLDTQRVGHVIALVGMSLLLFSEEMKERQDLPPLSLHLLIYSIKWEQDFMFFCGGVRAMRVVES